ncbi:MAG: AAA family ATPase [Candidatus Omnitrophota bacterium]
MSYFKILGLEKEPFSTSPDPEFFYQSPEHKSALYRLRIAIELRRGLSLVLGDVGTGKTTLSRKLSQLLSEDPGLVMAMVLNPVYESEKQFLADLSERFHIVVDSGNGSAPTLLDYMKSFEKFLFEQGVQQDKTVVLLIDESQKLSDPCMEILRALLNYETNEYKILQLVLMGQMELLPRISRINNIWDRIAVKYFINPLEEDEVRELINFRLRMAGYVSRQPLFDDAAIRAVFNHTQGYPRKIAMLCHDALEYTVMYNRHCVDRQVIHDLIQREMKAVQAFRYVSQAAG